MSAFGTKWTSPVALHMSAFGGRQVRGPEFHRLHVDCAISLACRVRCFGLPLYNAIAREALAARLGLLPF